MYADEQLQMHAMQLDVQEMEEKTMPAFIPLSLEQKPTVHKVTGAPKITFAVACISIEVRACVWQFETR